MNISVSVINCMHGRPAEGVAVRLERKVGGEWVELAHGRTDENGWLGNWHPAPVLGRGIYRLELDLDSYFGNLGIIPFHPSAIVAFRAVDPAQTYQLPVLATPYAIMTYGIR
jgi:5-hydroxyisourate hydrolase